MHIYNLISSGRIRPKQWEGVNLPWPAPVRSSGRRAGPFAKQIKWIPPDPPWIKLNIKGLFKAAPGWASGGGIVRGRQGEFLTAFTTPLSANSPREAELITFLRGLELAREFGCHIWIESDASQVTALLNSTEMGPAQSRHTMARIILLRKDCTLKITLVPKEGNKVAAHLAAMSSPHDPFHRLNVRTIPRDLRALIKLEQQGVPYIRVDDEEL